MKRISYDMGITSSRTRSPSVPDLQTRSPLPFATSFFFRTRCLLTEFELNRSGGPHVNRSGSQSLPTEDLHTKSIALALHCPRAPGLAQACCVAFGGTQRSSSPTIC